MQRATVLCGSILYKQLRQWERTLNNPSVKQDCSKKVIAALLSSQLHFVAECWIMRKALSNNNWQVWPAKSFFSPFLSKGWPTSPRKMSFSSRAIISMDTDKWFPQGVCSLTRPPRRGGYQRGTTCSSSESLLFPVDGYSSYLLIGSVGHKALRSPSRKVSYWHQGRC